MRNDNIMFEKMLEKAGIRPTANRLLVLRTVAASARPLSMSELEAQLETLEKSSVFRVLTLLLEHHLIHAVEDGRGIVRYELCHGESHCSVEDMHPHFYCEGCQKVTCIDTVAVPVVTVPAGFDVHSVNYMIKGLCPDCTKA